MPVDGTPLCIRCAEFEAADAEGYCGHCHWRTKAEVNEGFYELRSYLERWAQFAEWCIRNGRALPEAA